jgi:hypothetical protein
MRQREALRIRQTFEALREHALRARAITAFMQLRRDARVRSILDRWRCLRNERIAFPIDELAERYQEMLGHLTPKARDEPHRIILSSARVNTRQIERAVSNHWHGAHWVRQVQSDVGEVDSAGNEWHPGGEEAFGEVFMDIEPIAGGCFRSVNKDCQTRTRMVNDYKLTTFSPSARNNNCAFECLRHLASKLSLVIKQNDLALRKMVHLKPYTEVPCTELLALYTSLIPNRRLVIIIEDEFNEPIDMTSTDYILLHDHHYMVVESYEIMPKAKKAKMQRGVLAFDFETRPSFSDPYVMVRTTKDPITNKVTKTETERHRLVDTICHARFTRNGDRTDLSSSTGLRHEHFTTNRTASSARQFIDWLKNEFLTHNRTYQIVAYNGSRFDYYLLLGAMTKEETLMLEPWLRLRGKAIIGFQLYGCYFKDPNLFLMGSLEKNCGEFKLECTKQVEFTMSNGMRLDNRQLCYYRPELDVWDFIDLQRSDHEFWRLYMTYCDLDAASLYELWKRFREEADNLTFKMGGNKLLAKCRLINSNTIGGHAKKLLTALNQDSVAYRHYEAFFFGHRPERHWNKKAFEDSVRDRYNLVSKCKRGGISHCNQPGRHEESVVGVDIVSQYSTALMNMLIPVGSSKLVTEYEADMHGYYEVRSLRFAEDDLRFRCVAYAPPKDNYILSPGPNSKKVKDVTLKWQHPWNDGQTDNESVFLDSQMLKYLREECGLTSFKVVRGYVSKQCIKGEQLFGRYVTPLVAEKVHQDRLKKQDELNKSAPAECNMAMREVCKLLLNSLTGKLVEDFSKYHRLKFTTDDDPKAFADVNGVKVAKVDDVEGARKGLLLDLNVWVGAGVCVYSYSKILLWKYINLLPRQSEDVIHVETDGIYFPTRCLATFKANLCSLPHDPAFPLAIGDALGNVKVEYESVGPSYWLGKKFYALKHVKGGETCEVMRLRGVVPKTIAEDGSSVKVVKWSIYERVYQRETVSVDFATLTKAFYGGKVHIQAHRTQREVRPMCVYGSYS